MTSIAIQVENLSKQYKIGMIKSRHDTLRDQLAEGLKGLFRRNGRSQKGSNIIWALKDVSFEVKQGEVMGIIGRNGAGKSTLLKILSRITKPSSGYAKIHGRVGSLLEVGTGFHQELTGRENVFLNGAILGMKREEIEQKFDEIVAFSEVEKFIDTPVKHYSSGMYMRLAFAVAAHLEPEILLVDEVLAVGDAAFQKKCLGKMGDVAREGRTVLFVSHNIAAVQALSTRCLVFEEGCQQFEGDVNQAITLYAQRFISSSQSDLSLRMDRTGQGRARFTSISFQDTSGAAISSTPMGQPLRICLRFQCFQPLTRPQIGIAFINTLGQRLFRLNTSDQAVQLPDVQSEGAVVCEIPALPLLPGVYPVSIGIADGSNTSQDHIDAATLLEVLPADVFGTGRVPCGPGDIVFIRSRWTALYAAS